MLKKLNLKQFLVPVLVLFLALSLVAVTASPALAEDPKPPKPIPGIGKITDAELRAMLIRERAWYDSQNAVMRDAYAVSTAFQALIDYYKTKSNRDASPLETALAIFQQELLKAEASRANTVVILNRNAGFNGFFNVVDRELAGQTVLEVRQSLKGTHEILYWAHRDLAKAYHDWKIWIRRP